VIAVLFARSDSVYKTIPGCDVWDAERDARRWPANNEYRKFVAAIRQRKGPAATVARDLILERLAMVEDCIQEKAA